MKKQKQELGEWAIPLWQQVQAMGIAFEVAEKIDG